MEGINLETIIQVVTILSSTIGLLLGLLQIIETYIDIRDKFHKRQLGHKRQPIKERNHNSQLLKRNDPGQDHKSSTSK